MCSVFCFVVALGDQPCPSEIINLGALPKTISGPFLKASASSLHGSGWARQAFCWVNCNRVVYVRWIMKNRFCSKSFGGRRYIV